MDRRDHEAPGRQRPTERAHPPEPSVRARPEHRALASLQRAAGNRAVTAWMQRDDAETAGGQVRGVVRGCGRPLDAGFRSRAEGFFAADLARVRVHTGAAAARSAAAVAAHAYTSGSQIVFGPGQYDPSSDVGQHRLVHELTHVIQQQQGPVSGTVTGGLKISDPSDGFEREADHVANAFVGGHVYPGTGHHPHGAATDEPPIQLDRADRKARKARKARIKEFDATRKSDAKQAKAEATKANTDRARALERLAAAEDGGDKMHMSNKHQDLVKEFDRWLSRARKERTDAKKDKLTTLRADGVPASEADRQAEQAAHEAEQAIWSKAPDHIRAFRPLRFDQYDQALNEVKQWRLQQRAEEHSQVAGLIEGNAEMAGARLDVEQAHKKIGDRRDLERAQRRVGTRKGVDAAGDATAKTERVARAKAQHGHRHDAEPDEFDIDEAREKVYGKSEDEESAENAAKGVEYASKATKSVGGATMGAGWAAGDETAETVGWGVIGLGQVGEFVSDLISAIMQIKQLRKGTADKYAELDAAKSMVKNVGSTSTATRATLKGVEAGLAGADNSSAVIGSLIPIFGAVTGAIHVVESTLELIPIVNRLLQESAAIQQAKLGDQDNGPLVTALERVRQRNVQFVEKELFAIGTAAVTIGASVAELATAGGYGIPALVRVSAVVAKLAHDAGHSVHDVYAEAQAAKTVKAYYGAREEGAARDLVHKDAGTAVDILVLAAQKHQQLYAREVLAEYGVEDSEIDTMWGDEIRDKVLGKLELSGDPKSATGQVKEQADEVKDKIAGKSVKEKWRQGGQLTKAKNTAGYKAGTERGRGDRIKHLLRTDEDIEKSFARLRSAERASGTADDGLTYSTAHREELAEQQKQIAATSKADRPDFFDPVLLKRIETADLAGLYKIYAELDPSDASGTMLLEQELQKRVSLAGAGARK